MAELESKTLWSRPGGAASIAFHLKHIAGSLDRLLTYASDRQLTPAQLEFLAAEERETGESAATLAGLAIAALDRVLAINPDFEFARGDRLHLRMQIADWTGYEQEVSAIVTATPCRRSASATAPVTSPTSSALAGSCRRKASRSSTSSAMSSAI